MALNRRTFLELAAAATALPALAQGGRPKKAARPLKILILGGTGFLGPATIEAALGRGHRVTMFNRGRTRPDLFPGVERLQGDRDPKKGEGLKALEGRTWDVVIDNSAYYPRMVKASAELLRNCGQYVILSSISAYREPNPVDGDETAPLATMPDPTLEEMGKRMEWYGALKALCEQAAEAAMPGKVTVIRPGYIVGPDDPTGRFTYWPARFDQGGDVAVPGTPKDRIQVIDVRDLGAWLVRLAEDRRFGAFNACGPEKPAPWGRIIDACAKAAAKPSRAVYVPEEAVLKAGLSFPIWAPTQGDYAGFFTWKNDRALKAGLRFRPLELTVRDTLAWYREQAKLEKGRTRLAGPGAEAEAQLLASLKQG